MELFYKQVPPALCLCFIFTVSGIGGKIIVENSSSSFNTSDHNISFPSVTTKYSYKLPNVEKKWTLRAYGSIAESVIKTYRKEPPYGKLFLLRYHGQTVSHALINQLAQLHCKVLNPY